MMQIVRMIRGALDQVLGERAQNEVKIRSFVMDRATSGSRDVREISRVHVSNALYEVQVFLEPRNHSLIHRG